MTIIETIKAVLRDRPNMSAQGIYEEIIKRDLYKFGAQYPPGVVSGKLRMHCLGLDFPSARPVKYFKISSKENGKLKFSLLEEQQNPNEIIKVGSNEIAKTDLSLIDKILIEHDNHIKEIEKKLLEQVLNHGSSFFEQLIVDLLIKMGYGYGEDAGTVTGGTRDGGIDGIISEDKLGLDLIYLQAKRYDLNNKVPPKEIQAFVGAMQNVQKGVFITTGSFSKAAEEYAVNGKHAKSIKLIDGKQLTSLMVKSGLGVGKIKEVSLYKINSDYFDEL